MSSITGALARDTYASSSAASPSNDGCPLQQLPQELIDQILRHFFAGTTHRVNYTRPPSRGRQGKFGLSILRASRLLGSSASKTFYSLATFRHVIDLNHPFRMHSPSQDLIDLIQFASFEVELPYLIGRNQMRPRPWLDPYFEATLALFRNTSVLRKECRLTLPIVQDCRPLTHFLTSPFFRAFKHLRGFQKVSFEVKDDLYPSPGTSMFSLREEVAQANRQKIWAMLYVLRPALEAALGPSVDGAWREFEDWGGRRCEFAIVFRPRRAVTKGKVGVGEDDAGLYQIPAGPWPEDWEERYVELCRRYMVEVE